MNDDKISNHSRPLKFSPFKLDNFLKHSFTILFSIIIFSFILRLHYYDFNIPLTDDALGYFMYALDTNYLGHLPTNYSLANNGWSVFVNIFFTFPSQDVMTLMQLQRIITILLSTLTIIPVYFLCRLFFEEKYCYLGASFFAFEPRLIQNSLLGITEPLYILLGVLSLFLIIKGNGKKTYFAFALAALTSMVRSEGIFLFLAISIIFFIKYRKEKLVIPKYLIAFSVFSLILLPMAVYNIETHGNDMLVSRIFKSTSTYLPEDVVSSPSASLLNGVENFPKYLGWDLIPIFILFVPPGFILLLRNLEHRNLSILVTLGLMSLPAFYAYSIPLPETRYFYFLYPIFCILSLITIKKFSSKYRSTNLILVLIFSGILISSMVFLESKIDNTHEIESFMIAQEIIKSSKIINEFPPESRYLEVAEIPKNLDGFTQYFLSERLDGISLRATLPKKVVMIPINTSTSLEDYINSYKEKGLTHLVIDKKTGRPSFFDKVLNNEQDFPFLIKEFDSTDLNFAYQVKIYRIDYSIFSKTND